MELSRRETITLVGSVSSSLSLPVSVFSYLSGRASAETDSNDYSKEFRSVYIPGSGSGTIQTIQDKEPVSEVSVNDRKSWKMYARSVLNNVGISPPVLPGFDLYRVYVDYPYWHIAYTHGTQVIDIYDAKYSDSEYKAVILDDFEENDRIELEADVLDELVGQIINEL